MKLISKDKERFTFELSQREKQLLWRVLQLYPLVPPSHHQLNKGGERSKHREDQRLLEEAVAEQRQENRKNIRALFDGPTRFHENPKGLYLSLTRVEIECLLQALNDVRIGAWLLLGEPDELDRPQLNESTVSNLLAMDSAGHFQVELLAALGLDQPILPDEN